MTDQVLQLREWTLEQALAYDGGPPPRVATTAHPDCRCGKPKPALPEPVDGDYQAWREQLAAWTAEHGSSFVSHYDRRSCPQHRPQPRRQR